MRKIRGISGLMAGLFTMQMLATSFCLLMPAAHAGVMSQNMHAMASSSSAPAAMPHCKETQHMAKADHHGKSSACAHCDQPDELISFSNLDINTDISLPLLALIAPAYDDATIGKETYSLYTPTGPPDSSSLIYRTTQRIRI